MYFHRNSISLCRTSPFNFSTRPFGKTVKPERTEFGATILPSDVKIPEHVETQKGRSEIVRLRRKAPSESDPYEEIPGPRIFRPFSDFVKSAARSLTVGTLLKLMKRDSLGLFRKYGPTVKLPEFLGGKIVVVYKPEQVSSLFEGEGRISCFDSVERSRSFVRRDRGNGGGSGGAYLIGEEWEKVKTTVSVPSVRDDSNKYEEIQKLSREFAEKIRFCRNKRNETPEDFVTEINKWSSECLCFILFGKTLGFLDAEKMARPSKAARLFRALAETTRRISECESGLQLWRLVDTPELQNLRRHTEALDKMLSESVRSAQLNLTKKKEKFGEVSVGDFSLLEEMLLRENSTPEDVSRAAFDFLLVGTNAVTSAVAFFFYHAATNSRVQERLFPEIRRILPRPEGTPSRNGLTSSNYLRASINESLRLKMPRPVATRILSRDTVLSDYRVPRGTCVVAAAQIEGLKEENFEDPGEFRPERWSEDEVKGPFPYFPLTDRLVGCLGRKSAEEAIQLLIVHVLRRYRIEYNYEEINATYSVISLPDKPLRFTITEREL